MASDGVIHDGSICTYVRRYVGTYYTYDIHTYTYASTHTRACTHTHTHTHTYNHTHNILLTMTHQNHTFKTQLHSHTYVDNTLCKPGKAKIKRLGFANNPPNSRYTPKPDKQKPYNNNAFQTHRQYLYMRIFFYFSSYSIIQYF